MSHQPPKESKKKPQHTPKEKKAIKQQKCTPATPHPSSSKADRRHTATCQGYSEAGGGIGGTHLSIWRPRRMADIHSEIAGSGHA